MSHVDAGPLAAYNSLLDPNLAGYFTNYKMRRHLKRNGLITKRGEIVSENSYRINMARKEHKKHVRDLLAQAIVHKTLDVERNRQVEIKKKLEEISKLELVKRVKKEPSSWCSIEKHFHLKSALKNKDPINHSTQTGERGRKGDEEILPYLSPKSRSRARPSSVPNRNRPTSAYSSNSNCSQSQTLSDQRLMLDEDGYPITPKQRPISGVSTSSSKGKANRKAERLVYPKGEIDDRHLYALNPSTLRNYTMNGANLECDRHPSPYTYPHFPGMDPLPPNNNKNQRSKSATDRKRSSRNRRIHIPKETDSDKKATKDSNNASIEGQLILHRTEPAVKYQERMQTFCTVSMHYFGRELKLDYERFDDGCDEILIEQQHCGGNTLVVFKERLASRTDFKFFSRRHKGYPFSLSFYINGVKDSRISTCCEYKHNSGKHLGSKNGHFGFVGVEGAAPCYKCIIEEKMKKDKKGQKKKSKAKKENDNVKIDVREETENDGVKVKGESDDTKRSVKQGDLKVAVENDKDGNISEEEVVYEDDYEDEDRLGAPEPLNENVKKEGNKEEEKYADDFENDNTNRSNMSSSSSSSSSSSYSSSTFASQSKSESNTDRPKTPKLETLTSEKLITSPKIDENEDFPESIEKISIPGEKIMPKSVEEHDNSNYGDKIIDDNNETNIKGNTVVESSPNEIVSITRREAMRRLAEQKRNSRRDVLFPVNEDDERKINVTENVTKETRNDLLSSSYNTNKEIIKETINQVENFKIDKTLTNVNESESRLEEVTMEPVINTRINFQQFLRQSSNDSNSEQTISPPPRTDSENSLKNNTSSRDKNTDLRSDTSDFGNSELNKTYDFNKSSIETPREKIEVNLDTDNTAVKDQKIDANLNSLESSQLESNQITTISSSDRKNSLDITLNQSTSNDGVTIVDNSEGSSKNNKLGETTSNQNGENTLKSIRENLKKVLAMNDENDDDLKSDLLSSFTNISESDLSDLDSSHGSLNTNSLNTSANPSLTIPLPDIVVADTSDTAAVPPANITTSVDTSILVPFTENEEITIEKEIFEELTANKTFQDYLTDKKCIEFKDMQLSVEDFEKMGVFMEGQIEELILINTSITNQHISILQSHLTAPDLPETLKKFNLNKNPLITSESVPALLKIFEKQKNLEQIYISGLTLDSKCSQKLFDSMRHLNLKQLDISHSNIDNGLIHLSDILQKSPLQYLSVSGCKADEKSWMNFLSSIGGSSLTTLSLDGCGLTDNVIEFLCEALIDNQSLVCLDLENNEITDEGGYVLLEFVKNRKKHLTELTLSPGNNIGTNLQNDIINCLKMS